LDDCQVGTLAPTDLYHRTRCWSDSR